MNSLTVLSVLLMVVMVRTAPDPLPGDVKDVDPNNLAVKNAIGFLFNAIHGSIDTTQAIGMGKVLKTQSQVVSVILGGKQVVRSNDPDLQPIIDFTESMLNNGVNSIYTHKIANILKAERQVVSGDKYYLTFEFKRTNCLKGQPIPENCVFTKTEICSAEVWSQPWLSDGKLQLISFHCERPEKRDSF
ncbi:unnamed protein product [Medioppia subpectinata]|uniref:Cystatin domain-containing protein n=1 Tax=Medioppia subpectinata TaxID=1979941 RepID=A0A7R9L5L0_9ACAR|nr:unnamed protein product [Medioppia subpectinata]CAG2114804.1 unnamed protein product [Medioppia subpectinata]